MSGHRSARQRSTWRAVSAVIERVRCYDCTNRANLSSMVSRRRLDPASRQIADAWSDAKKRHPKLTQGEFARRTFPILSESYGKDKERQAWEEREGSRLLGRIIKGDAPNEARELVSASYGYGAASVEFRNASDDDKVVSYANFQMPLGFSTFDAFKMETTQSARQYSARVRTGRLQDSMPFLARRARREGRVYVAAVRPIKVQQKRPFAGEFRQPD